MLVERPSTTSTWDSTAPPYTLSWIASISTGLSDSFASMPLSFSQSLTEGVSTRIWTMLIQHVRERGSSGGGWDGAQREVRRGLSQAKW